MKKCCFQNVVFSNFILAFYIGMCYNFNFNTKYYRNPVKSRAASNLWEGQSVKLRGVNSNQMISAAANFFK